MNAMFLKHSSSVAILCLLLAACNNSTQEAPKPNNPAPLTIADALTALDKSGSVPVLNRDQSVAGPDTDNNGVRDDIDAYINSLPDQPDQKKALRQTAVALQKAMTVDLMDQPAVQAAAQQITSAVSCVYAKYDNDASIRASFMQKIMVNTKTRFQAYNKFNVAVNGTTTVLPGGDGCAI